jgi:TRAP-type transport system small permease protein
MEKESRRLDMQLINKWIDKVDHFFVYISAITIFVMMAWIVLDVILRTVFNLPIVGTTEIIGEYFMAMIVYLATSYTLKHNEHVSVDFLQSKFPKLAKKICAIFTNLVALLFFIILGMNNFNEGLEYFEMNVKSASLLYYPLAPALMVISLGILLMSLRFIIDSINILQNTKEL